MMSIELNENLMASGIAPKKMIKQTPMICSEYLNREFGCDVNLKIEIWNPTGSHKDRESIRIIETCIKLGVTRVGCASTGNFGCSLAYYSRLYGLECNVWLPKHIKNPETVKFLQKHFAKIHFIDASLSESYAISAFEMKRLNVFNANPGICVEKIEGNATIGHEILKQLPTVHMVLCCINNGTHIIGVAKGLEGSDVRLVGVYTYSKYASSISGFHQAEGQDRIQKLISKTGGQLIEASDKDLLRGVLALQQENIFVEVSSASVIGVLPKIDLSPQETVCCIITGDGKKKVRELKKLLSKIGS